MWKRCNETCFNQEILLINRQIYTHTHTHTDTYTHTSCTHTEAAAVALVFPATDNKKRASDFAGDAQWICRQRKNCRQNTRTHTPLAHTLAQVVSRKQQTAKWANWQDKRPIRTQWKGTCLMRYAIVGIQFYFVRFRFLFLYAFLRVVRICVFFFKPAAMM